MHGKRLATDYGFRPIIRKGIGRGKCK